MFSEDFKPDWASAPGDTINDILYERGLSEVEFAQQLGYTSQTVKDLLQGHATITIATARRLEKVLGASVEFWMSRDFQYRRDIARLNKAHQEWLAEIPIGDMIKFGWLKPVPHPTDEVAACLKYFGMPSIEAWHEKYLGLQKMVAFRTSSSLDSRPGAVAAWLRQGEIEAEAIRCRSWNAKRFQESLPHIRTLTREKNPVRFIPEVKEICAESGVAVVIVRSPAGCRASGATRFLTQDRALLQLSFRYLTDDHFWFTFFHEAGHLLLHGDRGFFLEEVDGPTSIEEDEANEFASCTLIPPQFHSALLSLRGNSREVIRFALQLGVSPGIVVGQLQHHGKIKYNWLNRLKRRYKWEE